MRKLYTLAGALLFGMGLFAQSNVTFMVDMNNEVVSADGVHLAGSFGDDGYDEWSPSGMPMSDDDMDGVYELTLQLSGAYYEFKFINGNDWPFEEDVPNICQVELDGNSNRSIDVAGDMTYAVCFASCGMCNETTVLFRVDVSLLVETEPVDVTGIHVAGNFQGAVWNPGSHMMTDEDGDMVYEALVTFDPTVIADGETLLWKYINGNDWFYTNESVPGDCGDGTGNRQLLMSSANVLTDVYCFNACGSCVAPTMVTFAVDMSNETVSPNGVHLAGAFQGWSPGATEMTDDNADMIYEVTLPIPASTYEYKVVNGNNWNGENNSSESPASECNVNGNRQVMVEGEEMSVAFCYNQCNETCVANPDPADITFRVNMAETAPDAMGVWLIGDFTVPQWQGGAVELTDLDADMVYEATITVSGPGEIKYKFVNGDVNDNTNEEINMSDCAVPNGLGGFNRVHNRTGEPEVLSVVCFDACADCSIDINELAGASNFNVYPNPSNGLVNISFDVTKAINADLKVINSLGQVILFENIGSVVGNHVTAIDLSTIGAGVYTVQLIIENGQINRQLIVR